MTDLGIRKHMRREVPLWWALTAVILSVLLMLGTCVAYTNYVDHKADERERRADRRWCALLQLIAAPDTPPTTPRGEQIAHLIKDLIEETGC